MKSLKKYFKEIILFGLSFIISFYLASKFYGGTFVLIIPFPLKYPVIYGYNEFIPTSIVLGLVSLGICYYLMRTFILRKDKKKIWYFPYIAVIISIFFHGLFFAVEPKYTFYEHPEWFMYMDSKGEYIQNIERYFYLVEKLGFKGNTYRPFKTLDDSIKGLEFAKKWNQRVLYIKIVKDVVKEFGLQEIYKNYSDVTFQSFILIEGTNLYANDGFGKGILKDILENKDTYIALTEETGILEILNIIYGFENDIMTGTEVSSVFVNSNIRDIVEKKVMSLPDVNSKVVFNP